MSAHEEHIRWANLDNWEIPKGKKVGSHVRLNMSSNYNLALVMMLFQTENHLWYRVLKEL